MASLSASGLAALRRQLSGVALAGAQGGSGGLAGKLEGEGTGVQYPGLPRRSSAPGEYPAEQSGDLRDSIAARQAGEGAEFGPINNPPDYVLPLHFRPPSDGGRPFMDMALHDPDIHAAVLDAVEREAGRQFGRATVRRSL